MLPFDTSAGAVPRAPALAQALARCAAGAAQRRLILDRSGAERAECPVILGPAARRGTRCALAVSPAFRGAPEIAHAGLRLPRRWVRGVRGVGARAPPRGKSSCGRGGWVRRAAGIIRACYGLTHTNHGVRASPMAYVNSICPSWKRHCADDHCARQIVGMVPAEVSTDRLAPAAAAQIHATRPNPVSVALPLRWIQVCAQRLAQGVER